MQETQRVDRELSSELKESPVVDRELSSELRESPIKPAFLLMCAPFKDGYSPLFYLQINGEALWQWRKFKSPSQLFDILQDNWVAIHKFFKEIWWWCKNRKMNVSFTDIISLFFNRDIMLIHAALFLKNQPGFPVAFTLEKPVKMGSRASQFRSDA